MLQTARDNDSSSPYPTYCPPRPLPSAAQPKWGDAIEAAIAQVFGVERDAIRSRSRGRASSALARQVAMYVAHVACGFSLTDVGRLFERDRTTVAHACGAIEDRRDDPMFDRTLDLIELIVRAMALPRRHQPFSSL